MRHVAIALTCLAMSTTATAQSADASALRSQIKAYSTARDAEIVRELSNFLAIPNLASDQTNIRRNAAHLMRMMETLMKS